MSVSVVVVVVAGRGQNDSGFVVAPPRLCFPPRRLSFPPVVIG